MHKQLFLPLLLLLALLGLGGCHRDDPTTGTTTVSGQVVVYQTSSEAAAAAGFQAAQKLSRYVCSAEGSRSIQPSSLTTTARQG